MLPRNLVIRQVGQCCSQQLAWIPRLRKDRQLWQTSSSSMWVQSTAQTFGKLTRTTNLTEIWKRPAFCVSELNMVVTEVLCC